MNRALLIVILSFLITLLMSSCQSSPSVNTSVPSPSASAAASPSAGAAATPNAEKTGTKGPHCDDPPPANPSTCTPPIDEAFVVGCNLPFTGQPHDIDQHCPNEGCAKKDNDKAQNR